MSKPRRPCVPCACGYVPRPKEYEKFQAAMWQHRNRRQCRAFNRPAAALLAPKNGRFDSAAALDVLLATWKRRAA